MFRYVTPAKLCWLVLVELYISGDIPSTAKLDVLSFISSQINLPSDYDRVSVEDRFKLANSDITAISETLSLWRSANPELTVYQRLLHSVWELSGPDSLYELFERLRVLVKPKVTDAQEIKVSQISRSSPLGQFLRRSCYEFERLQFADVQKLWNAFVSYRAPSYDSACMEDGLRHMNVNASGTEGDPPLYSSTEDKEILISFWIHQLQQMGMRLPERGTADIQRSFLSQWDSNTQSLQHFMDFFETWRAGQSTKALDSLRRYFDYSLGAKGPSDNVKLYYQYALLHQSVLFADFECWEESVNAMDQCIATARENNDATCLNFALSWLMYLRQAYPTDKTKSFVSDVRLLGDGNAEHDEITFLKAKARETKHWSLLSSTLLEEAKLDMYSGNVKMAFEHIVGSSFYNGQHDQRALMPATAQFEGASVERLGQSALSSRILTAAKLIYCSHTSLGDRVRLVSRLSHGAAQQGHYTAAIAELETLETQVERVEKLRRRVAASKNFVKLKRHIHRQEFTEANILLNDLSEATSGDSELNIHYQIIHIEFCMQESNLEGAFQIVNREIAKLNERRNADIAQRLKLLILKSRIFIAANHPGKALSLALRVASTAERHRMVPLLVEALAALSAILLLLREPQAAKNLVEAALPHALEITDAELAARLFLHLVDIHADLALRDPEDGAAGSEAQHEMAETCLGRSLKLYSNLEDLWGIRQCLQRGELLAQVKHDAAGAAKFDEAYELLEGDPRQFDRRFPELFPQLQFVD